MGSSNRWNRMRRNGATSVVLATLALAFSPMAGSADAAPNPPFIAPSADWLTTVNYYRAMSGLGTVNEDPTLSSGALQHSCYMLQNGISHDELPGKPGYTPEGDSAGNNGNVAVSSVFNQTVRSHIELWMTGPYHAIGILRPNLRTVGFGKCDRSDTPTWHSGATLDVLHGLVAAPVPAEPILFPGNGTTTNLDRFIVESPNPLDACGWTGSAGLPVIAMMPENAAVVATSISGPAGPLQACTVSGANTDGTAKAILDGNNAAVVIPRSPLAAGTYTVNVRTTARDITWSFTVDPDAAIGAAPAPIETAGATLNNAGLQPLSPSRVVDTRINRGAPKLTADGSRRIQIAGNGGVPAGATAVVANVTATEPAGPGFVSLWNCAGTRPTASTLNFGAAEIVPNSATIPLDADGGLCVYSFVDTHLVVDITGYYSPSASGRYTPVTPSRIMDTRIPVGPSARMNALQIVELQVTGVAGVPSGASGVALNVTTDDPSADGVVSVYPCDGGRPESSSLNPSVGKSRANLVISSVSSRGTVCVFSLQPTQLVIDVSGYFAGTGSTFSAVKPFRFTDTRDGRSELNAGLRGMKLTAGTVVEIPMAGVRGIAGNATAISANITVDQAGGPGWVAAWPCGARPEASNINYDAANPVANAAELTLSASGTICIMSYANTHVIIDVNGWWSL